MKNRRVIVDSDCTCGPCNNGEPLESALRYFRTYRDVGDKHFHGGEWIIEIEIGETNG